MNDFKALFSPGQECKLALIDSMHQARFALDICVFTIADNHLTEAIVDAHNRGVDVRVLSDNDKSFDRGSDIQFMERQGVNVRLDNSPFHMHHKFMVVDKAILVNGSFNWTRSASEKNQENICIIENKSLAAEYLKEFDRLWRKFS